MRSGRCSAARWPTPTGHFERLERSLGELRIAAPMSDAALSVVLRETVRRNRVRDGLVYLQVTRGVARRDHAFPDPAVAAERGRHRPGDRPRRRPRPRPAQGVGGDHRARDPLGAAATSRPSACCPTCWPSRRRARPAPYEAWFVDELGLVTEGASTNAWIVDADGALRTRDTQANILRGITRKTLLESGRASRADASRSGRSRVEEAKEAREAFITGAGTLVLPVVSIDGATGGRRRARAGGETAAAALYRARRGATAVVSCAASRLAAVAAACADRIEPTEEQEGTQPMPTDKKQNLQDTFLNSVRRSKTPLTIFLVNGVKLQGVVSWFDNFCVLLRRDGQAQLVYKHAISTIMPAQPVQLYEPALDEDDDD